MYIRFAGMDWIECSHRIVELEEGAVLPEGVRVGNLDAEARRDLVRSPAPSFLDQVARDLFFAWATNESGGVWCVCT